MPRPAGGRGRGPAGGRPGHHAGDLPGQLLDGEDIVFRSAPGSKVAHGADSSAAFEVDHLDRAERRGWSIVATGHLEVVDPRDDAMARLRQLPVRPWAAGDKDIVMRLVVGTITGRVIGGPDDEGA